MGIVVRAARAAERAFKRATKWAKHRRVVLGPARKIGETSPQFYTRGDLCSPPFVLDGIWSMGLVTLSLLISVLSLCPMDLQ